MVIIPGPDLEAALTHAASRQGVLPEALALDALRQRFLTEAPPTPSDEWERRLLSAAKDCGVSLTDATLLREAMYD